MCHVVTSIWLCAGGQRHNFASRLLRHWSFGGTQARG